MFTKAHSPIAFAHDQQGTQCFQAGTFSCRSIMDPRFLMIMQKAIPAFGSTWIFKIDTAIQTAYITWHTTIYNELAWYSWYDTQMLLYTSSHVHMYKV